MKSKLNITDTVVPQPRAWTMSSDPMIHIDNDAPVSKVKRTELQHKPSSIPGREIVQVLTEVPPGVESGWHVHSGEEVGYVLAGTVKIMTRGRATRTLRAGDGFLLSPGTPHNLLDVGTDTGRMLSTYVVAVGASLADSVQAPLP